MYVQHVQMHVMKKKETTGLIPLQNLDTYFQREKREREAAVGKIHRFIVKSHNNQGWTI